MSIFRKKRCESTLLTDSKRLSKRNVLLSILITTLTMAAFWVYSPPRFVETNDDVVMASILYGYNGEYDGHMYFINVCLGAVLEICVRLFPTIPWYTIAHVGTIYVSFIVVVFLLLQKFRGYRAIFPIVTLWIFFGYESFCSLQFTKTAAIGSIGGLLLVFYAVENHSKWPTYLLAGLLALMGSFFRFTIFEMMLGFFFIIGLFLVVRRLKTKDWNGLVRLCVPFALIIAVCFCCYFVNQYHYSHHPNWKIFDEYNLTRVALIDKGFPNYQENIDLYTELNVTENDYNLYSGGNYADPELFTPEVMSALAAVKEPPKIDGDFFKSFVDTVVSALVEYAFFPALGIAFLLAILSINKSNKSYAILIAYELIVFVAVQIYFYYSKRYLQLRVDMGIMLALYLILFLYSVGAETVVPSKAKTSILLSVSLLLTTVPFHLSKYEKSKAQLEAIENTQVYDLLMSDPGHYYFYPNSWNVFPDKMYDAFTVEPFGCGINRSILGTWRAQTPPIKAKWGLYGITNPYRDMLDNSGIYLLCTSSTAQKRVLTHIVEHYDENAACYLVKDIEGVYKIYRVATSNTPAIDTSVATDGSDLLNYDVSYSATKKKLSFSGYLYQEGVNSYVSNIYIGVTGEDNVEQLYYTTQYDGAEHDDVMNGSYGYFKLDITKPKTNCTVRLYLEADGVLYYTQADPFFLE